ncbi:MAG: hypothetical protein O3A01_00245 [bacterium]|nr:hypothetical protein [bacterium]
MGWSWAELGIGGSATENGVGDTRDVVLRFQRPIIRTGKSFIVAGDDCGDEGVLADPAPGFFSGWGLFS